jgi:hypothetical protein
VPKAAAEGYREVKTAWMDIGGCGGTIFSPPSGTRNYKSKIWPSTMAGQILFVQGHVHEVSILHLAVFTPILTMNKGALNSTLFLNRKPVCISTPLYGRKTTSIDPFGKEHISDSSVCTDIGELKKGDEVQITTHYDSNQHPYDASMPKNGIESVMAIANVSR